MCWSSDHLQWLTDTGERLTTADGLGIEVWEFTHCDNNEILSSWASHFRNHYCLDSEIDLLRGKKDKSDYLEDIKFPSKNTKLGPGIRAGDFGEILIADYLEWVLGHWVPRVRWGSKMIRDESPKGTDVLGFRFHNKDRKASKRDVLFVFESKTKFSKSGGNRLQIAINDSAKDHLRIDESLNYIKQKFIDKRELDKAKDIERYQSPVDLAYKENYGAAAVVSNDYYDTDQLEESDCTQILKSKKIICHPNRDNLVLLVIKGASMMDLVHDLYGRAASEA